MEDLDGVEVIAFTSAASFESWLAVNHRRQKGVWLKQRRGSESDRREPYRRMKASDPLPLFPRGPQAGVERKALTGSGA